MKNLILPSLISTLLLSHFAFAEAPAVATPATDNTTQTETEKVPKESEKEEAGKINTLRLQHDDEVAKNIKPNLFVLLQTLKDDISVMMTKHAGKAFDIGTKIELLSKEKVSLTSLNVQTHVQADGQGQSKFAMPAISDAKMSWEGMTGLFNFNKAFSESRGELRFGALAHKGKNKGVDVQLDQGLVIGQFDDLFIPMAVKADFPKLTITENKKKVELTDIKADIKADPSASGVYLQKGFIQIGKLFMSDKETVDIQEVLFELDGKESEDKTISYLSTAQIKQFLFKNNLVGEEWSAELSSDIALNRLDVQAILKLQKAMRDVYHQYNKGKISEDDLNQAFMTNIFQLGPELLTKSPELAINNINVTTAEGNFKGNMLLSIDGNAPVALDNPFMLLSAIGLKADMLVDKKMMMQLFATEVKQEMLSNQEDELTAEQKAAFDKQAEAEATQRLDELLAKKHFIAEGDKIKSKLEFKQGQLLVNDQVIPLF